MYKYKKKITWTVVWLIVFGAIRTATYELVYMRTAADAANQLNADTDVWNQAFSVKVASGLYQELIYGILALILIKIWIGPVTEYFTHEKEMTE